MERIASFCVDHTRLERGMYLSRQDGDVLTWDIRMKKPNQGDYLTTAAAHTLEHLFAIDHIVFCQVCLLPLILRQCFRINQVFLQRNNVGKIDLAVQIYVTLCRFRYFFCLRQSQQVNQRGIPISRDLIGGVALRVVNIALGAGHACQICLGCAILLGGVDTAHQHAFHRLLLCHRRSVVRILRTERAISRDKAIAGGVFAQQIVQVVLCCLPVGVVPRDLRSYTQNHAGVSDCHVAAPIKC